MTALLLLLAAVSQSGITVNVIDQTTDGQPAFGQPVISGDVATFPDTFRPRAFGAGNFDTAEIDLGVSPTGLWRVTIGGNGYGINNESWLLVAGETSLESMDLHGVGPWTQSLTVNVDTVAGDFNGDGAVNAADYTTWRNNGLARNQYDVWRSQYGAVELRVIVVAVAGLYLGQQPPNIGVSGLSLEYLGAESVPDYHALVILGFGMGYAAGWRRRR